MKRIVSIIILLSLLIIQFVQIGIVYSANYDNTYYRPTKQNTMTLISGTYGEKGMFWRWWPPGYDEKPEADILTTIIVEWGNKIVNEFNGNQYNYGVARHTYYWINNNPSRTPNDLWLYVKQKLSEKKTIVAFIGHTLKDDDDKPLVVYEWNPDKRNYFPTNWLLPNNANWAPNGPIQKKLYPVAIRNRFSNKEPDELPKMAIIIACKSGEKQDDPGGWAWAYRISENDPYDYWHGRVFIGFTTYIAIDQGSRDFKAAELIKRMIYYMNQGDWTDTAFRKAANDLNYDYERKYFKGPNSPIPPDHEQAIYIGRWFKLDPTTNMSKLIKEVFKFLQKYLPKTYSIIGSKHPDDIKPLEKIWGGEKFLLKWDIPVIINDTRLSLGLLITIFVGNNLSAIINIDARIDLPDEYYTLENEYSNLKEEIFYRHMNSSEKWSRYKELESLIPRWRKTYYTMVEKGVLLKYFLDDINGIKRYIEELNNTIRTYNYTLRLYPYRGGGYKYYESFNVVYIPYNATLYVYNENISIDRAQRVYVDYSDLGGSGVSFDDLLTLVIKMGLLKQPNSTETFVKYDEAYRIASNSGRYKARHVETQVIVYPERKWVRLRYVFIRDTETIREYIYVYGDGDVENIILKKKGLGLDILLDYLDEVIVALFYLAILSPIIVIVYYKVVKPRASRTK